MSFGMVIGVLVVIAAFGGANVYLARRLYGGIIFLFPHANGIVCAGLYIFAVLVMILGAARLELPLPEAVRDVLGFAGACEMGIFVYLLLYIAAADIFLLMGRMMDILPSPLPRSVRFRAVLAACLLTILTSGYGIWHAGKIREVSYDIALSAGGLPSGMKLVLVSDIHLGAAGSEERLTGIVRKINALEPDLVCVAGDIFDNDYHAIKDPDKAIRLLKDIRARYGVYACPGNHDAGETAGQMEDFLERGDVNLLNDSYTVIGGQLVLAGRLDPSPIGGYEGRIRKDWAEVVKGADARLPLVVMDHNPANIDEYGEETDLVLSGHTHKGQIFPGSLITGAMYAVDHGYYRKDEKSPRVIVTSGAGTWGMPMRVGTDCEIVSIRLH